MALFRSLANQFKRLSVCASIPPPTVSSSIVSRRVPTTCGPSNCFFLFPQLQVREMGYKLKTKSAVKKRFKVNRNGLVKRSQANKRHLATKKTRERIRRLGKPVYVEGKIRKNIIDMIHH